MIESVLARQFVEFAIRGQGAVDGAINRIQGGLHRVAAFVTSARDGMKAFHEGLQRVAAPATRLAAVGAGLIGLLGRGALKDTSLGDQLAKSFELASRVLGGIFAPYMEKLNIGLQLATAWFNKLDDGLKRNIARWALIAVGAAAFVAILPTIVGGVTAVITVIAGLVSVVTSPWIFLIGGVTAAAVALARFCGFINENAPGIQEDMDDANKGWLENLLGFVTKGIRLMADFFNFVMHNAARVSDWLADKLAIIGEFYGVLPKGTTDMLRKMPDIQAPQIDMENLDAGLKTAKKLARDFVTGFENLGKGSLTVAIRGQVGFESLQGTFERLQKAMVEQDSGRIEQALLGETKEMNQNIQKLLAEGINIKGLAGVVQ